MNDNIDVLYFHPFLVVHNPSVHSKEWAFSNYVINYVNKYNVAQTVTRQYYIHMKSIPHLQPVKSF